MNQKLPTEVLKTVQEWTSEKILYWWEQEGTYFVTTGGWRSWNSKYQISFLRLWKHPNGKYNLSQDKTCFADPNDKGLEYEGEQTEKGI